ncbi:hypothetical protein GF337_00050 [candidate division KSB1 bacterium]|nr:hypothetical protein [candidate division KSB1 bacterium]
MSRINKEQRATNRKSFITKRLQSDTNNEFPVDSNLIAQRWRIADRLPSIRNLMIFIVHDTMSPDYCCVCGATNAENSSEFCQECGYFLKDSPFLMIEGDHKSTNAFEFIYENDLQHDALIRTLDTYLVNGKKLVLAEPVDDKTLSDLYEDLTAKSLYEISLHIVQAIEFLHDNSIYNIGLKPEHLFISQEKPRIVDLSESIIAASSPDQWRRSDIKSFGDSFLQILSAAHITDQNLKRIFSQAAARDFETISELRTALSQLGQNYETTDDLSVAADDSEDQGCEVNLEVGKSSNVGQVRSLNEDSLASLNMTYIIQSKSTPVGLYIVADGMGGHAAGEEASKIAVQSISQSLLRKINDWDRVTPAVARQALEESTFAANDAIFRLSQSRRNNMGTTITVALVIHPDLYIMNVGDGRAYLYKNKRLELITADHSLVYRLYKTGQITYPELRTHPEANQILSALGDPDLKMNLTNLETKSNHPYFFDLSIERADGLLLCSDGLWQMLSEEKIEAVLKEYSHPQHAADVLVKLANQNGGDDNISVIYVKTY